LKIICFLILLLLYNLPVTLFAAYDFSACWSDDFAFNVRNNLNFFFFSEDFSKCHDCLRIITIFVKNFSKWTPTSAIKFIFCWKEVMDLQL